MSIEEAIDDRIKAYLEECEINLEIEPDIYNRNSLELTIRIDAPREGGYRRSDTLMEATVTFEVGEENEED
jgi:hypothetical protein